MLFLLDLSPGLSPLSLEPFSLRSYLRPLFLDLSRHLLQLYVYLHFNLGYLSA